MITNLTELIEFLKNKDICVLGNSRSILNNKKDIDKYEVVCRMNLGTPQGKEEFIGSRTDVLFISTRFTEELYKKFNAKYVMWMTECNKLASDWIKEYAFQNPIDEWRAINSIFPIDKLPSTGLLALNFLINYIPFKSLTIYGFDCFCSGTWYHKKTGLQWHSGTLEKKLILDLIGDKSNIKWIIE